MKYFLLLLLPLFLSTPAQAQLGKLVQQVAAPKYQLDKNGQVVIVEDSGADPDGYMVLRESGEKVTGEVTLATLLATDDKKKPGALLKKEGEDTPTLMMEDEVSQIFYKGELYDVTMVAPKSMLIGYALTQTIEDFQDGKLQLLKQTIGLDGKTESHGYSFFYLAGSGLDKIYGFDGTLSNINKKIGKTFGKKCPAIAKAAKAKTYARYDEAAYRTLVKQLAECME